MTTKLDFDNDIFEFLDSQLTNDDLRYEFLLSSISLEILSKRIDLEMNQRDFAKLLGVSQPMVSKLESNTYNPTIKQLYKTCEILDLNLKIELKPRKSECIIEKTWFNKASKTKYQNSNPIALSA